MRRIEKDFKYYRIYLQKIREINDYDYHIWVQIYLRVNVTYEEVSMIPSYPTPLLIFISFLE